MKLPVLTRSTTPSPATNPRLRTIGYLRFSLTRACHMRCIYCRPEFDRNEAHDQLSPSEIEQIARHMVARHGVRKIRLTGGDPTARQDLLKIIETLARIDRLHDLAMTTHGLSLATHANDYADAGLRRVNVSLDSLDPRTFRDMTGTPTLDRVLAGIDRAIVAFEGRVKLNTVVVREHNLQALPSLLTFAADRNVEIRFIELMPMGPLATRWEDRFVSEPEMRGALSSVVEHWTSLPETSDSARRSVATLKDGREVNVGFITPMSCNFCSKCDRLRIASDGSLYPCLMDKPAGDILHAVRPGFDPAAFERALADAIGQKPIEHPHDGYVTMTHIGG